MHVAFADFVDQIRKLPTTSGWTDQSLHAFLLEDGPKLRMYYAPFDWINTAAKIVVVGITPGENSMHDALAAARDALHQGLSSEEASKRGKRAGSFSNMRRLIAVMFDELGIPAALGINRSDELFAAKYDLLHPTSCIRYPVFKWSNGHHKWINYPGHGPSLLKWPTSLRFIEQILADELQQVPDALVVPCGEAVSEALQHLASKRLMDPDRCLFGFPHASGQNGHRKKYFEARKNELKKKVAAWALGLDLSPAAP